SQKGKYARSRGGNPGRARARLFGGRAGHLAASPGPSAVGAVAAGWEVSRVRRFGACRRGMASPPVAPRPTRTNRIFIHEFPAGVRRTAGKMELWGGVAGLSSRAWKRP